LTDDAPLESAGVARRAKGELARAQDIRFGGLAAVVAGVFVAWCAVALKVALSEASGGEMGYILLMTGAVVAAWFAGLIGGLTATIAAGLFNVAVTESRSGVPLLADQSEQIRLALYMLAAAATVVLVATRRAASDRLAGALDEVAELADEIESRDTRLEIMLAASGTGFWEWDIRGGKLTWSEAIFRQHGMEPTAQAPDFPTYLTMIHEDDRERFQRAIEGALSGDRPFDIEFRLVWEDGSIHWTRGSGRVFRDVEGRPMRMIGTGQDVTEQRRLEEERDALLAEERRAGEFREAFIDVISHELRTPITTILGLAQILARPGRVDDPAERMSMLQDVRAESERLHRLVEDLLVLSRVERGALQVDTEPIEPRRLLDRIVAHESEELPSISISLVAEDHLPVVAGEVTYIEQILRNLLGNVAKYTPVGTAVTVDARREGDVVAIRVRDKGPGIPARSHARLFELFYRDPDSARTVSGSGIGLFVCASLVEAMGGRIWVTSPPGGGAEFGFTLRTLAADEADLDTSEIKPGATPVA
jgi:PAS domain S-box-containing protein